MSVLHAECHFAHVDYDYPVLHSGFHYLIGISLSSLNLLPDVLNVKNKSPLKGLLLLFVASLYKMCTVGHMPQNHSGMCWQTETMSVQDLLNENQKGAGEPVSHGHQGMTVAKFFLESTVIHRFLTGWRSVPLTPVLFRSQLYYLFPVSFPDVLRIYILSS